MYRMKMRLSKYIQNLITFLFGCLTVYVLRRIPQNGNSQLQEFSVRETIHKSFVPNKQTPPTVSRVKLTNMVDKSENFTRIYVGSVFCNKNNKHVPFKIREPLLVPEERFTLGKELVILVISSHDHTDFQKAVRQTWANKNTAATVTVLFVLGIHTDDSWNKFIVNEHKQYGDILQLDTPDHYRNLPVKILSAFQWVLDSVRDVKHVLKSDDDVYLYLPNVLSVTVRNDAIVGAYNPHSLVSRNTLDDWGVTKENYLPSYVPPYVSGGSYLMSAPVTRRLLQSLISCRNLHIEDVFITGILAMSAGVTHQSHTGFSFWTTPKAKPCDFIKSRVNSVNMSAKQIYTLHRDITSNHTCEVK